MTLPNLERPNKKTGELQEGIIVHSPVTDIYYKKEKGIWQILKWNEEEIRWHIVGNMENDWYELNL